MSDDHPFEDDDTLGDEANARALAELRAGVESGRAAEEGVQLEVGAPVHEEEDPSVTPRQQARRDRGRLYREANNKKIEEARDESAQLRAELTQIRGQMDAIQHSSRQQREPQEDPYDARIAAEQKSRTETHDAYNVAVAGHVRNKTQMPSGEYQEFMNRNSSHDQNITRITVQREMAAQNTPEKQYNDRLMARYPDVMSHDPARNWSINMYAAADAAGEIGNDPEAREAAVAKVMRTAARKFRLGQYDSPEPSDKQLSSNSRVGRSGGAPSRRQGQKVDLSPAEKRMAMATYSHLDNLTSAQKFQMWLNSTSGSD